jgi:hypothetical protein
VLVDDFGIPPIDVDVDGYVQIARILPIRSTRYRAGYLLPLAYGYRIAEVEYRLLPVRVLGERGRGETERLAHASEGAFEVRHEAVDAIVALRAQAVGRRERQVVLGALLKIDVQDRDGIRNDKLCICRIDDECVRLYIASGLMKMDRELLFFELGWRDEGHVASRQK